MVKKAIMKECKKYFITEISTSSKLAESRMSEEKFEMKNYIKEMKMTDAQEFFKYRTKMTNVKYNYKHDKGYSLELWKCDSCLSNIETQSHILWCPAYQELRTGKSLESQEDLVNYIKNVLAIREKLNLVK